jgi:hypothetical protein
MLAITTTFEHIGHWIKMRQSLARFSGPESSPQIRSLADFIATTSGFSFSVHTGIYSRSSLTGTRARSFLIRGACENCRPHPADPACQAARFLCHVYKRTRGPSSHSYAAIYISRRSGILKQQGNSAMTKTLTLTASMMILLAISGHASRARYLSVATDRSDQLVQGQPDLSK